jgi:hypothetical protein
MNVLVTGACGVTSRAVVRSLRCSPNFAELRIVGTDVCDNPYALFEGLYDKIYRAPHVAQQHYGKAITDICSREKIDAAIIIPELEVLYWSGRTFPAAVALPPPQMCHISGSKRRLYEALASTGLVPRFSIVLRHALLNSSLSSAPEFPLWIRDFSEGATSGKGSLLAHTLEELRAWAILNPSTEQFMISEFLPGRNFACHLLYNRGVPVKIACYERLEYFMARTVMSGISGNISKGRLLNDARLPKVGIAALEHLLHSTGETMHGIVAIDLREAADGSPLITEVNLRHVAATYSFAAAGFNLAEAHLLVTLGHANLGPVEAKFPADNMIFRDIDGPPIWVSKYEPPTIGQSMHIPKKVEDQTQCKYGA